MCLNEISNFGKYRMTTLLSRRRFRVLFRRPPGFARLAFNWFYAHLTTMTLLACIIRVLFRSYEKCLADEICKKRQFV